MMHHFIESLYGGQQPEQPPLPQKSLEEAPSLMVALNHAANKTAYEGFIATLSDLCERANQIFSHPSKPWNFIEIKAENSPRTKFRYCFSNCDCFNKNMLSLKFPFIKQHHFKRIRLLCITISQKMEYCDISIKDIYLVKIRKKHQGATGASALSSKGCMPAHQVFPCRISDLGADAAMKILDWLLFKTDTAALPFPPPQFNA